MHRGFAFAEFSDAEEDPAALYAAATSDFTGQTLSLEKLRKVYAPAHRLGSGSTGHVSL